jgi:tetratricopeptide (TPR) repeat protein
MSDVKKGQGYIKTENTILLIVLALIIGFLGGVVFSVYRWSHTMAPMDGQNVAPANLSQEQLNRINSLKEQIQNDPTAPAWSQLGHLYFDTGQLEKAIEAYEKSISLNANQPNVLTDLGVMYRRNKNPKKAIEQFNKAIAISPDHEIALYNKGIVLMHDMKDSKGAADAWSQLLILNPDAKTPSGEPLEKMVKQLKGNLSK